MDKELENAVEDALSTRQFEQPITPGVLGGWREKPAANGQTPPTTDLARLNNTINSLYNQKRQQLADLIARQAAERTNTITDYARQLDDLKHRAGEALRDLEGRHAGELAPLQELIARIEGMR